MTLPDELGAHRRQHRGTVVPMTEQQPYDVIERYPDFELRSYPRHVVAEVTIATSFENAGTVAFRALFGYISGQNRSRTSVAMTAPVVQSTGASQKIAMTAPVVQHGDASGEQTVAFVLPSTMTQEDAPQPTDPAVTLRTVESSLAAAARYSGRWSQSAYEQRCESLTASLAAAGFEAVGAPRFARFDPPFKPWFLRRNEVLIDVRRIDR